MPGTARAFRLGKLPERRRLQTRGGVLEYVVSGHGRPAIVLFNGAGVTLDCWRALYPGIEALGTVFAWNRFGVQGSDAPRVPQSGAAVVSSLRELLAYAAVQPPLVLVGHSLGGLFANLFARLFPQQTAAVLFLEATHPGDHDVLRGHEAQLTRSLGKLLSLPAWRIRDNLHAEIESIGETVRGIEAAGPFPPVPVGVVTGGTRPPKWLMSPAAQQARLLRQQDLARLSPRSLHVTAGRSGHFPQLTEPRLVLDLLGRLVERCG